GDRLPRGGSALGPYPPDPGVDEVAAHATQAGADPALDRTLGLAQPVGDLAVGQTAEIGELDDPSLLDRQALEHLFDVVADGQVEDLALDVVAGLSRLARLALLTAAPRCLRPEQVDGPAVALGQQERPQRSSLRVEAVGLRPQTKKDLLHDLL